MYGEPTLLEVSVHANETTMNLLKEGSLIRIKFGYKNKVESVETGDHTIDTIEKQERPSTIRVTAVGYNFLSGLDSGEPIWRRNTTLTTLLSEIVNAYGLFLTGNPSPSVVVGTRSDPSQSYVEIRFTKPMDLLYTLGKHYGFSCQIEGSNLKFWDFLTLDENGVDLHIRPTSIQQVIQGLSSSYRQYSRVFVKYGGSVDNPLWAVTGEEGRGILYLENEGFYFNLTSALRRSLGERRRLNNSSSTLKIRVDGNYRHIAGINVEITGMVIPENNGKYRLYKATHQVGRNGWDCDLELQKIL